MSKYGIAHRHASISKHGTSSLLLLAHQVLWYCSLAKPDSHTKSNSLVSQRLLLWNYLRGEKCDDRNWCSLLSLFTSFSSMYLNLRSLQGFTTLVTVHGTVASLWGNPSYREAPFSDHDFRQRRMLATLELLIKSISLSHHSHCGEIRSLDT